MITVKSEIKIDSNTNYKDNVYATISANFKASNGKYISDMSQRVELNVWDKLTKVKLQDKTIMALEKFKGKVEKHRKYLEFEFNAIEETKVKYNAV